MIVRADRAVSRAGAASFLGFAILCAAASAFASPAAAQAVGATLSLFTDDRFRGYSLSDGRPAGTFDLSYDARSGLYGAVAGTIVATRHDGLQPLRLELNGGYARRLSSGLTLDLGIVHSNYSTYSRTGASTAYTEVYAGVAGKILSSRISVSPDYFQGRAWTVYSEIDGKLPTGDKLHVTGHVGLLVPLTEGHNGYNPQLDWRVAIARDLGRFSLHAAFTGTGPGRGLDRQGSYGRPALTLGLTYAL